MKKSKKILLTFLSVLLVLFVGCTPFFSSFAISPSSEPFQFPCGEPPVSSTTGYIAVAGERVDLSADYAFIWFYQITPLYQSYEYETAVHPLLVIDEIWNYRISFHIVGDEYCDYSFSYGVIDTSGNIQSINSVQFHGDFNNGYFDFNTNFRIDSVDFHGNIDSYAIGNDFNTFRYLFTSDSYDYLFLKSIFQCCYELLELSDEQLTQLQNILSSSLNIENKLDLIVSTFGEQLTALVENSDAIKLNLINMLTQVDMAEDWLAKIYEEFPSILWLIDDDILALLSEQQTTNLKLDELRAFLEDLFTVSSETSTYPEYSEIQSGVEKEESQLNDAFSKFDFDAETFFDDFDINQNAVQFIWELFENIMNSHPNLFIFLFAMLILGFVSFVLLR